MGNSAIIYAVCFAAPAICASVCMALTCADAARCPAGNQRNLRLQAAGAYLAGALCWLGLVLYVVHQVAFTLYLPVFTLMLMLDQVLLYRLIYSIIGTGEKKNISPLHYFLPAVVTLMMLSASLYIPLPQRQGIIYGEVPGRAHDWFSLLYLLTSVLFVLYNAVYPALGLWRIRQYRKHVANYSADVRRSSLGWMSLMMALILVTVPVPLAGLLIKVHAFTGSFFIWLGVLPTFVVYVILCYNLISSNFVIIETTADDEKPDKPPLDRVRFEKYIAKNKPYVDPDLRITDMARAMHTNRSYLSAFINREYGVNFCRYINRLRLRELERLYASPKRAETTNIELVLMAGFSSYRSYLRVKEAEDKSDLLKWF